MRDSFAAILFILSVVASTAFVQNVGYRAQRKRQVKTFMSPSADGENRRRMAEFLNLEPPQDSVLRRERMERDSRTQAQFATHGDDLWELREQIHSLTSRLLELMKTGSNPQEESRIRSKLYHDEQRDPEIVYKVQLEEMKEAEQEGRMEDARRHKDAAMAARSCLPQFNLEGLWVGKYGGHGYEMINVTYVGDTLVARKVTGDANVPRGEITFQADLSPLERIAASGEAQESLQPIMLTNKAAKKWGTKQLPRYSGLGQVAEEGFTNSQWMEGQLILIGQEYFSFAWIPIEHQIFFGRPSPELALKMLRDGGVSTLKDKSWSTDDGPPTLDDDLCVLRDYANRCLEVTSETIEEDLQGDEFGCIWHGMDTEECYFE